MLYEFSGLGISKSQSSLSSMGADYFHDDMRKGYKIEKEDTGLTQLIFENGELNEKGLDKFVMKTKLAELGVNYAVVSIIGPQSSGKSTLLNHLFGTTFQEMNALKGRTQTTLGIWIAKASHIEPCTLVVDVEGSDGIERGEDGTLFEKQSALFSLAVSDVVLINMWCKDIGREQGGSRPLLKIVFEKIMNLKSRRKTTLLFVLRDKSKTPLDILQMALSESIEKIYDSVPKPEVHKNSSLRDLFNLEVTSLPSYEYQEELFLEEVNMLRKRFVNSTSLGGLAGDKTDKVPSPQISYSIKTIWKTVKENKDLDLPAHKIMVDTVRCDQIAEESFLGFVGDKEWRDLEMSLKSGPVVGFGVKLSSIINRYLSKYDAKTIHCDENVKIMKRQTLLHKLVKCIQPANESMLEHQYLKAVKGFKKAFDKADLNPGKFLVSAKNCSEYAMSTFAEGCKEIEIEHMKLDTSKVFERVERDIHQYVAYVTLKIDRANAEAATAAAIAEAAASKAAADKADYDAKVAANTLAAAHAAVEAARDAKAASDARVLVQKAAMDELIAATNAATASNQAMVAQMTAERAAAAQKEKERLVKEREKRHRGCTIQ